MSLLSDRPASLPFEKAHKIALADASTQLQAADIDKVCRRTGAATDGSTLTVVYFGETYAIALSDVTFDQPAISPQTQILILHYLISDGERATKGEHTSFKNLPDGNFYQGPYSGRTTGRILRTFGGRLEEVADAGLAIGGVGWSAGDFSIRFQLFPMIDAILVVYDGDEEFPPDVNILYSDNIINFLTLEDVAVLGGDIASRLSKAARR